jgi:prephenate dehydrogenase
LQHGCVQEATTELAAGVREADLIVVCSPVERIAAHVIDASTHCRDTAVITDAGSTKAATVRAIEAAFKTRDPKKMPFVGGHPLAGSEQAGCQAAVANLFEGRVAVVTPTANTTEANVAMVEQFWQSLGSRTLRMGPEEHDTAVARTSHLPHLIASALAAATPEDCLPLTASGWLDTTRIAAGDVELWRQIFFSNRGPTLKALADFETVLARLRTALETADSKLLAALLAEGKSRRDALGS